MATKAKADKAPADVEVLPALPEAALGQAEGSTVASFLAGLVPFFRGALAIETAAKATLSKAQALTLPQPGDIAADEALQTFIRQASADKKAAETYWGITAVVHQLHRKLTAGRQRPVSALEEAQTIAQRLHNTFVEAANREAAKEQERLRRDAELQAALERADALAKLEAQALAAEAASADLSEREVKFVNLIVSGLDPTAAAFTVSFKTPAQAGARLMGTAKIQAAIKGAREAAEARRQAEAVKAAPVQAIAVEVKAQVSKASGATDRTTHSAEVTNERLLIEAVIGGQHGIPADILMVNQAKLNEYARSLRKVIDRWPGCRHKETTKTV